MKKVLLIGGTSQIGQEIIAQSPYDIDHPTREDLDLSNVEHLQTVELKKYDILILNAGAGMAHHEPFSKNSIEKIKNLVEVNTLANFILINRYLTNRTQGTILFVGSRATQTLKPTNIVYATTKLAVTKLMESLRKDYLNFKFLIVNPGKVKSKNNLKESSRDNYIEPKDMAEKIWYMIENKIERVDYF